MDPVPSFFAVLPACFFFGLFLVALRLPEADDAMT
jgi:hypothetical protein